MGTIGDLTAACELLWEWTRSFSDKKEARTQAEHDAVDAVSAALLATRAYLRDLQVLQLPQEDRREREKSLASTWHMTASKISDWDTQLAHLARKKATGWADPGTWQDLQADSDLSLDAIDRYIDFLCASSREDLRSAQRVDACSLVNASGI